jgi:hypothetical protein
VPKIVICVSRPKKTTDGATVHALKSASGKVRTKKCVRKSAYEKVRPKKSYFLSAWEYVKLPFSLRLLKNYLSLACLTDHYNVLLVEVAVVLEKLERTHCKMYTSGSIHLLINPHRTKTVTKQVAKLKCIVQIFYL